MSDVAKLASEWRNLDAVMQIFERGYSGDAGNMEFSLHTAADSAIWDAAEIIKLQQAEIDRLRAALKRFGAHDVDCQHTRFHARVPCDCGLSAAIKESDDA